MHGWEQYVGSDLLRGAIRNMCNQYTLPGMVTDDDIEDIMSSVHIRLMRHGDFSNAKHAAGWISQATRSALIDYVRKNVHRPSKSGSPAGKSMLSHDAVFQYVERGGSRDSSDMEEEPSVLAGPNPYEDIDTKIVAMDALNQMLVELVAAPGYRNGGRKESFLRQVMEDVDSGGDGWVVLKAGDTWGRIVRKEIMDELVERIGGTLGK